MFYAIQTYSYAVMMKLLEQKVKRQNSEIVEFKMVIQIHHHRMCLRRNEWDLVP